MWRQKPYNPLGEYKEQLAGYGLDRLANIIDDTKHELVYKEKKV